MTLMARGLIAACCLVAGVAGGVSLGRALDAWRAEDEAPLVVHPSVQAFEDAFVAAAERARKSVVHITTRAGGVLGDIFPDRMENVGSGVVVGEDGHILTNNHVVADPTRLRVRFSDGRELPARVVGKDVETDLALVKIDVPEGMRLTAIRFADSDAVRVGEWCLAIGNPFGMNHSVSHGIVSAKQRRVNMRLAYQDFIQTDAAINPGNSGGALINLKGELIGINTLIISPGRSSAGIGLAISSNLARSVKESLLEHGRVRRGYLGVRPWDLDGELVAAMRRDGIVDIRSVGALLKELNLEKPFGVFLYRDGVNGLEAVIHDSPAGKAGLKEGDVIVEFNGKPLNNCDALFTRVAAVAPGTTVTVKAMRDGKPREFQIKLAERPASER